MPDLVETVMVTGAAGFIGSHCVEALLERGSRVVGVDSFDSFYDAEIKRGNIAEVLGSPGAREGFELVEGDICDAGLMDRIMVERGVTRVLHLAARAGVRPSIADPALYARVNVEGTSVLLESARKSGMVDRFVLASSSSVYGNNEKVPFSEEDDVNEPISPYAATKRACELMGYTHWKLYGMPVACLRFFTVYGPRQRPDLAIAKFLRMVDAGEAIPMFGNGATSRDYTYIDDIVSGVLASLERIPEHGYRIWNLGGSDPVRLDEMIATVEGVVGKRARTRVESAQMGDVERTFADLSRSREELGYAPATRFADGVRKQWEWLVRVYLGRGARG